MSGRWPANVILSPGMAEAVDEQSGLSRSQSGGASGTHFSAGAPGVPTPDRPRGGHDDEGGASRFFLNAGYEPWELDWILANGLRPCGD